MLQGDDPTTKIDKYGGVALPFWTRMRRPDNVMILAGVLLVLAAFHFTYWSKRAEVLLNTANELIRMDYLSELRRMVEVGLIIENPGERYAVSSEVIPNIFNTDVSSFVNSAETLQYYSNALNQFFREADSFSREYYRPTLVETLIVRPAASIYDGVAGLLPVPQPPDASPSVQPVATPVAPAIETKIPATVPQDAASPGRITAITHYERYLADVNQIIRAANLDIGAANFAYMKAALTARRDNLLLLAEMNNRWVLPMIYGALGAVVYSIVRYLNVFLSDPPLRTSILRVLFGGFTGITISMLFGPSSLFSFGSAPIAPSLLLICFLFGYSLDSFLGLLRRADSYISASFGPRSKER